MRTLAAYLPVLACGAMMLLICIPMMRNMHKKDQGSDDTGAREEIKQLRDELERLKTERVLEQRSERVDG